MLTPREALELRRPPEMSGVGCDDSACTPSEGKPVYLKGQIYSLTSLVFQKRCIRNFLSLQFFESFGIIILTLHVYLINRLSFLEQFWVDKELRGKYGAPVHLLSATPIHAFP